MALVECHAWLKWDRRHDHGYHDMILAMRPTAGRGVTWMHGIAEKTLALKIVEELFAVAAG